MALCPWLFAVRLIAVWPGGPQPQATESEPLARPLCPWLFAVRLVAVWPGGPSPRPPSPSRWRGLLLDKIGYSGRMTPC